MARQPRITRDQILERLMEVPSTTEELKAHFTATTYVVRTALRLLRDDELIEREQEVKGKGYAWRYSPSPKGIEHLKDKLELRIRPRDATAAEVAPLLSALKDYSEGADPDRARQALEAFG